MTYIYEDQVYEIIIEKKPIKNSYIRVKPDLNIYISVPKLTPSSAIKKLIKNNTKSIDKMLAKQIKTVAKSKDFYYLGEKLTLFEDNAFNEVYIEDGQIYYKSEIALEKWLNTRIKTIFSERLDHFYNIIEEKIPYPKLKLRSMTSRWGVCKTIPPTITLNKKLIRYDMDVIDYVVIHELCHLVYPHHQKEYWNLVSKYCPNYKYYRKKLKE